MKQRNPRKLKKAYKDVIFRKLPIKTHLRNYIYNRYRKGVLLIPKDMIPSWDLKKWLYYARTTGTLFYKPASSNSYMTSYNLHYIKHHNIKLYKEHEYTKAESMATKK